MLKRKIKGAEALLLSLLKEGVDTLFGYPGGTIIPLYDQLYSYSDRFNHILVRHEQCAVHAAEGYARATGKTGVCMATAGPGATNTVTGIADAYMDSTPIVCITAQVGADKLGTNFFQEADTISITIPVTKWSYQITAADEIPGIIAKAFYIANHGRPGPVLISLTRNAQTELMEFEYGHYRPIHFPGNVRSTNLTPLAKEAAKMINESNRPLIIAGQGVVISGAESQLAELAERGNIPVACTLLGLSSIPTSHPLFAGNVGMHGNLAPNLMTQRSDLIIAAGMRFSDRVTGDTARYAPNAKIIHIDIDKAEFNKNVKTDLPILGDVKEVLGEINPGIKRRTRGKWFEFMLSTREKEYDKVIGRVLGKDNESRISMAGAVDAVSRAIGGDAIIVTDVGQHQMFAARYSRFNQTRSMITSGGLGTMGFGLPAAIGAKIGMPSKTVVLIVGDGGLQMSVQELGTIMQSKIDIKIVLLNNSYLGMVRQWQQLFFDHRYSFTKMVNPDFTLIAGAYGIEAKCIKTKSELECAVKQMINYEAAYLLEIKTIEEENVFPMIPAGSSLDDIMLDNN
jgi:acetolactate synthase-1/2/3 large subunit